MDKLISNSPVQKSEIRTERTDFSDGSYEEIRVEKVEGGYIKCVTKHFKGKDDCWEYTEHKSVSIEDPLKKENKEVSLIDTLKQIFE